MTALPTGHTIESLAQSKAGRVYLAARVLPVDRHTYQSAIDYIVPGDFPEYVETCNPPHPECYAYMFDDGSLLIADNADDEVWADEADYLDHYGLERIDHLEHGWMFVSTNG